MSEYVVIYERGRAGWGAYCPDLPGLGVAGATRAEGEQLIHQAIKLHIESLRMHGEPVPRRQPYSVEAVEAHDRKGHRALAAADEAHALAGARLHVHSLELEPELAREALTDRRAVGS